MPSKIENAAQRAFDAHEGNPGIWLAFEMGWKSGRSELLDAVKKIAARGHVPDDVFAAIERLR